MKDKLSSKNKTFNFNEDVICKYKGNYIIGSFLGDGYSKDTYIIDIQIGLIYEQVEILKSDVFKYTNELYEKFINKKEVNND